MSYDLPADRYQKELDRIKSNVETSRDYFREAYLMFHKFRRFTCKTAITEEDIAVNATTRRPNLEFNIMNAFVARLKGEFSKQEPSIGVTAGDEAELNDNLAATIKIVDGHLRHMITEADGYGCAYDMYAEQLTGGFSVLSVRTDYQNELSMNQDLIFSKAKDPTLCYFDPLATEKTKCDGNYAGMLYPLSKEDFIEQYPKVDVSGLNFSGNAMGFRWAYMTNKNNVMLVCDHYEKKKKRKTLVKIADGRTMLKDEYEKRLEKWETAGYIAVPPAIVSERTTTVTTICRYRLIENQIIEYTETDFKELPLIWVDGDSELLKENPDSSTTFFVRPYPYHLEGAQKLKNFAGQCLAAELQDMIRHKIIIAKEAIAPAYSDALKNNQIPNVIIYNHLQNNDPNIQLPPPREIVRTPIPQEVTQTFVMMDQLSQSILGSYDASLGINNNQLSGVAMVEGATQSNAAAMPYVVGQLSAWQQAANIALDMIPKLYITPRTVPVINEDGSRTFEKINHPGAPSMSYASNALNVKVTAGVNYAIQKNQAIQQMLMLQQANPEIAQFMAAAGAEFLFDNIEIRGIDQLKLAFKKWAQQQQMLKQQAQQQQQQMMQQQQGMPNPVMAKIQNEAQKNQIAQAQLQMDNQHHIDEMKMEQMRINNDREELENDRLKTALASRDAEIKAHVDIDRANAEREKAQVEGAVKVHGQILKEHDLMHKHAHDTIQMVHDMVKSNAPEDTQGGNDV